MLFNYLFSQPDVELQKQLSAMIAENDTDADIVYSIMSDYNPSLPGFDLSRLYGILADALFGSDVMNPLPTMHEKKELIKSRRTEFFNLVQAILNGEFISKYQAARVEVYTISLAGTYMMDKDLAFLAKVLQAKPEIAQKIYNLNISANLLSELPNFSFLPNLTYLHVGHNFDLAKMPEGIANVKELTVIHCPRLTYDPFESNFVRFDDSKFRSLRKVKLE